MVIDIKKYKNIYFLGIGGISMSGLAEILSQRGYTVSGSDMRESDTTKHLESIGINVNIGHNAQNITDDIDMLVYTAAVKADNPELEAAKSKNIKIIDRAELLGGIMCEYHNSIAIAGTHGKTTTTSMVSEILLAAKTDPTISIGGVLPSINGNIRVGRSDFFVAEACEYFDSFLKFRPHTAIILNIEEDHLDYFKDLEQIRYSFRSFAKRIDENGSLIISNKISNLDYITEGLSCNVVTYGIDNSNWYPENIEYINDGMEFDVYYNNKNMGRVHVNVIGEHNILNALAACASTYAMGVSIDNIIKGLKNFDGVNRRFQFKGYVNGAKVVDDYAHHPTEIKATLAAAKNTQHEKIWCVFQPHTFSRTKAFLNEFSEAFTDADEVVVADIYAAREKDTGEISAQNLVEGIKRAGKPASYQGNFEDIEQFLKDNVKKGDLVITMGAGDILIVGEHIVC